MYFASPEPMNKNEHSLTHKSILAYLLSGFLFETKVSDKNHTCKAVFYPSYPRDGSRSLSHILIHYLISWNIEKDMDAEIFHRRLLYLVSISYVFRHHFLHWPHHI